MHLDTCVGAWPVSASTECSFAHSLLCFSLQQAVRASMLDNGQALPGLLLCNL